VIGFDQILKVLPLVPKIRQYLRRPQLRVYFDAAQTYHIRAVVDAGGVAGYFCHLMVANDGREVAHGCQGRLLEVHQRNDDGSSVPAVNFVAPVILKWAHEPDWGVRDIDPRPLPPRRLDLGYAVESQPNVLRFFAPPMPLGVQTTFPPGVYLARVRVDSANARSAEGWFRVDFTHGWNQIVVAPSQG